MVDSLHQSIRTGLHLAASFLAVLSLVHLVGCEGAGAPTVGGAYGYAHVCDTTSIVCTCSPAPPPGCAPAAGYDVYIDDTSGAPDATTGSNGYWSVSGVRPGLHTVYICPPGSTTGCLSFQARVFGGMRWCQPSHGQGGGP